MNTEAENRRKFWLFAGGVAVGVAGYLALRYPVETGTKIANGWLRLRGASFHEIPWPGGTVRYVMAGTGTTPLVILHGIGDSPDSFGLFASGLLRDYRICMPILPGHPGSPAPDDLQFGHMVQAVDSVILREFGGKKVHLVGNSLGGWVASLFAAAASERLESLMLINPAGLHQSFDPTLVRPTTEDDARRAMRSIFGRKANKFPRIWHKAYSRAMQARSEPSVVQMMLAAPTTEEPLKRITARTTVVVGERDRLVPPEESVLAADLIGHANIELIPGGSHLPHMTDIAALQRIVRRHTNPPVLLEG